MRQTEEKVHEWLTPTGPKPEPERRRDDANVPPWSASGELLGMRVQIQDPQRHQREDHLRVRLRLNSSTRWWSG